jgi:dTMP kinase
MTERGRFITLEGIEGVGKSTQAAMLADWLESRGVKVVRTREPGGTPTAERIRALLKDGAIEGMRAETELLLMFAARTEHAQTLLRPALEAGKWVVCDRFVDASFAYQGHARGLGVHPVNALANWLVPDLRPDLTLWLDMALEEAQARMDKRGEPDRFEKEANEFFRRVQEGYQARARAEPERFRCVDASGSADMVQGLCRELVGPMLQASA